MSKSLIGRVRLLAIVFAGLSAGIASAHHGVTGQYDASRPIAIVGTVTAATFSPPHPVMSVQVEEGELPDVEIGRPGELTGPIALPAENMGDVLEIEFAPASMFYDLRDRLQIGDRVVVLVLRNCRPPHELRSSWILLSNATVVSYDGDWARMVDGCS